ncbi:TetR/AcrR family transcriptional regulator [Mycolicibacterium wolinskyi]|uniref:TetR family transcriptional regulator n=1 Tax=Mycolicibacterium wolinskyi TaxID=59750 RepID=A0A1X2FEU0_9MYCO|nr:MULTISPECIES: TetR/AcrR family transcriptional regulator [Mycolicibacterium]MCV7290635.1 TetR/AcrR family transcriptional regulator [Mycolicibacterium wolinskyi]MCV7291685.1 TetR/AcrR family transcriptional regulator [Mycolicibacterium goodii]ORX16953.1 TetR family transcriptional regulator [Mycolicibacterium wolinskyi]
MAVAAGRNPKRGRPSTRKSAVAAKLTAVPDAAAADPTRRTEILKTANSVIATTGLRSSLQQIADAAGILAGSLYHHFESKEAILVELIRLYHADLDRIGDFALERLDEPDTGPATEQITALGCAIARCAVEHRAALQMSFFEGPSADPELIELTARRPSKIQAAMLQALRAGRWSGDIRSDVDLQTLADRLCQSMLHVGLDVIRHKASPDQVATLKSRIALQGLAVDPPSDTELDRSEAFAAAQAVIDSWDGTEDDTDLKAAHLRAVARTEFGRRGYEMTTIRDIASAAGLGTGTVYRIIGSKDELLMSIMLEFGHKVGGAWTDIVRSNSTTVQKLDALSWLNINALDQFPDEFRIQLAWLRHSPPDTANPAWSFTTRIRQMKALLGEGIRAGEIHVDSPTADMLTRCIIGEQWIPENILQQIGTRNALILARDTVLRGIAVRR